MEDLANITEKVNEIFAPHELWAVGGSVRDSILGRQPKDFDFTTALPPDEIEAYIKAAGRHCNPRGKRFGTLGFKIEISPRKFLEVEVTTFRREQYTSGSRHPSVVEFVDDLKEDLSRRDFTMNAIAYRNNDFYDPFSGRLDILARKIKAVGEATDRFKDDPLRMLRAARFAAQLGFEIDPNMIGKIRKMPEKILIISRERWMQELDKLLVQESAVSGMHVLWETYLLKYLLPEVYLAWSAFPLEMADLLENTERTPEARWAALLSVTGRPYVDMKRNRKDEPHWPQQHLIALELAKGMSLRLKWSNDRRDYVLEKLALTGDASASL